MAAYCSVTFKELKKALEVKRLGTFPAIPGWRYEGEPIVEVELTRYETVRYYGRDGKVLAVFQNLAFLDD